MKSAANLFLHALHLAVICFSFLGWIWPQTRPWHLVLAGLIAFSWFVLGPLIGRSGFCFLTGVQHALWRSQGREAKANYMVFLCEKILGRSPNSARVDVVTQAVFYSTTVLSLVLYFRS